MNRKNKVQTEKICNNCGQVFGIEQEHKATVFTIEIPWGFFSKKDGEIHKITLCENCYDNWIKTFQIPVEITERVELL